MIHPAFSSLTGDNPTTHLAEHQALWCAIKKYFHFFIKNIFIYQPKHLYLLYTNKGDIIMKAEVIKTHKKITLKTDTFTFSTTINRYSCSGSLSHEDFSKLVEYVENLKGLTYGERFEALAKTEVLSSLVNQKQGLKIGDKVHTQFGKHVIKGTIIGERKNAYEIKDDNGQISVVQKVILL